MIFERWPDGAPLGGLELRLVGEAVGGVFEIQSSRGGRVPLEPECLGLAGGVHIHAEGFSSKRIELDEPVDGCMHQRVELVPTRGWYGRVLTHEGQPWSGLVVDGWWIESPRPFLPPESSSSKRKKKSKEDSSGPPPLPEVDFVCARESVKATAATNAEGWFYVEALPAPVVGRMTLLVRQVVGCSDVLRFPIRSTAERLPDLVVHPEQFVAGKVVDGKGRPIAAAVGQGIIAGYECFPGRAGGL